MASSRVENYSSPLASKTPVSAGCVLALLRAGPSPGGRHDSGHSRSPLHSPASIRKSKEASQKLRALFPSLFLGEVGVHEHRKLVTGRELEPRSAQANQVSAVGLWLGSTSQGPQGGDP